jgi:hypothetical protein
MQTALFVKLSQILLLYTKKVPSQSALIMPPLVSRNATPPQDGTTTDLQLM